MPCGCKGSTWKPPEKTAAATPAKPTTNGPKIWTGSRPAAKTQA